MSRCGKGSGWGRWGRCVGGMRLLARATRGLAAAHAPRRNWPRNGRECLALLARISRAAVAVAKSPCTVHQSQPTSRLVTAAQADSHRVTLAKKERLALCCKTWAARDTLNAFRVPAWSKPPHKKKRLACMPPCPPKRRTPERVIRTNGACNKSRAIIAGAR